ncbi:sulfite reductase flavoprotein subunit alpha [Novosphingobium sp. KA1]|uniref:PepSY domain-containing protein n=1 Tax=Novosphingobium sp. (strain KA1) TaxID=164608 RepID=UPI001A8E9633|nr:sulfite reductase flavoprotein subunit alpha [Novosphingobium sp. KA1]QSR20091.1 sulfite reductase subunit alpha [Novosphingobium sp. KA1]
MARRVLFQVHWFLGITAGLVLAVMGITGATLSFENEIMRALSPGVVRLAPDGRVALSPQAVLARVQAQRPGERVERFTVAADAGSAWEVRFAALEKGKRGERARVDPRDGRLLGKANGEGFFQTVENIHRWLALPEGPRGIGRQITGFAAISLLFFALSGIYLRWPRRALDWRAWLVLDWRKSGRNLYRALHVVIGTWVALAYLLSALTGLWWSYEWYREGAQYVLTGKVSDGGHEGRRPAGEIEGETAPAATSLARAWPTLMTATGGRFDAVQVTMPETGSEGRFRVLLPGARHDRMTDDYSIDLAAGHVLKVERYADKPLGTVVASSMYEVHRGAIFGLPGRIVILITSLTMPLFTVTGLLLYFARRRRKRAVQAEATADVEGTNATTLVAYASQTGGAERLARQTAAALGGARLVPLASLDEGQLAGAERALFVVSTYGEGEPPDTVRRFARQAMAAPPSVAHLDYAVLALGDREYAEFCAFGHKVDGWLRSGGATPLFETIEVDGEDPAAHGRWQHNLALLGAKDTGAWAGETDRPWRLVERELLNPGSAGGPVYRVALEPADGKAADWRAGDIAEVLPGGAVEGAPVSHREYSIASIPADGRIEFIVRQVTRSDGTLGHGSGWLTVHAAIGSTTAMRLRSNSGFHTPREPRPLILIGNGTGIAGLRSHLRQAACSGQGGHWLLLGERNRAHDALLADELAGWLADGTLTRLDRAWSRDADCGRYVQDLVADAAPDIAEWVDRGAAILVCGSLQGMAPAVDAALRMALGEDRLDAMAEAGLYLRDIY